MFKTLLVVTYVSFSGQTSITLYPMENFETCQQSGNQIRERVKAGKVSTLCKRERVEPVTQS